MDLCYHRPPLSEVDINLSITVHFSTQTQSQIFLKQVPSNPWGSILERKLNLYLHQMLTNFLCEGPNSKPFRCYDSYVFYSNDSVCPSDHEICHRYIQMNVCRCILIKLYLWTLKSEFHIIFPRNEISLFFIFSAI